jgi:hypothetical protein
MLGQLLKERLQRRLKNMMKGSTEHSRLRKHSCTKFVRKSYIHKHNPNSSVRLKPYTTCFLVIAV